jgi:SAM-dependent methyltransferase
MSFSTPMLKLATRCAALLPRDATVVELGNQTLSAPGDVIKAAAGFLGKTGRQIDAAAFNRIAGLVGPEKKDKVGPLYRAMGFAEYVAIDINTLYGSLVMDLNEDIAKTYGYLRTFDLVTNFGTGEHVFNQSTVFRNMHQLAKPGGLLAFNLPFFNNINHGFFNFSPGLFLDLAHANDYELVHLALTCGDSEVVVRPLPATDPRVDAWRWGELPLMLDLTAFSAPARAARPKPMHLRWRHALGRLKRRAIRMPEPEIKPRKLARLQLGEAVAALSAIADDVQVAGILRKTRDNPFAIPMQGKYVAAIGEDALRRQYSRQQA